MGALLFGAAYQSIMPAITSLANLGSTILPSTLSVDLWLTVLFFAVVVLTLFYFLERHGELRRDKLKEE